MSKYLFLIVLAVLLASCGGKKEGSKESAPVEYTPSAASTAPKGEQGAQGPGSGLTVNEQAGLKEITDFYGGKCTFSTGETKKNKKFFRIEVSRSGSLDSTKQIAELNASNIALMFYKDLREERSIYDEIKTVIIYSDGQKLVKSYTAEQLEIVLSKMMVVRKIALLLRDKQYDDIAPLLNDKSGLANYNKEELIAKIKRAEPSLGNVKEFVPYGFVFMKADNKKLVLHISGVLLRDTQNNEFSVDFEAASTKDEAVFLNYKL